MYVYIVYSLNQGRIYHISNAQVRDISEFSNEKVRVARIRRIYVTQSVPEYILCSIRYAVRVDPHRFWTSRELQLFILWVKLPRPWQTQPGILNSTAESNYRIRIVKIYTAVSSHCCRSVRNNNDRTRQLIKYELCTACGDWTGTH